MMHFIYIHQFYLGKHIVYQLDNELVKYKEFLTQALQRFDPCERLSAFDADIKIAVLYENKKWVVRYNNIIYGCFDTEEQLHDALLNVLYIPDSYENEYYGFLHGGCVGYGDQAMLIIAPTTVGKSTTIFGLCMRKCEYLSDDLIVYNYSEQVIQPYPLPIAMRDISIFDPSDIKRNYYTFPWRTENNTKNGGDQKQLYFPRSLNPRSQQWPLGSIYVLDRNNGGDDCSISLLSANEAFITVYKNCSNPFTMRNNNRLALEIAKVCKVWKVRYNNGLSYLDYILSHFYNH